MAVISGMLAGTAVIGAVAGGIGRRKGAKSAQRAGHKQADLIRQETAETARRMDLSHKQTVGTSKAATYASGIQMSGSNERYIQDMQEEMAREMDWLKASGESAALAAEKGADINFKSSQWGNLASTAGGITSAFGAWYG